MIILLAAALLASSSADDGDLERCRPLLEQRAGGEIATLDVTSSRGTARRRTIEGRLTAFLGMGPPRPGAASTHHLIRADFIFRCTLKRHSVRSVSVAPQR